MAEDGEEGEIQDGGTTVQDQPAEMEFREQRAEDEDAY